MQQKSKNRSNCAKYAPQVFESHEIPYRIYCNWTVAYGRTAACVDSVLLIVRTTHDIRYIWKWAQCCARLVCDDRAHFENSSRFAHSHQLCTRTWRRLDVWLAHFRRFWYVHLLNYPVQSFHVAHRRRLDRLANRLVNQDFPVSLDTNFHQAWNHDLVVAALCRHARGVHARHSRVYHRTRLNNSRTTILQSRILSAFWSWRSRLR